MKKTSKIHMARRIREMRAGDQFQVETPYERWTAVQVGTALRCAGVIMFHVKTWKNKTRGGFTVAAVS